MVIGATGQLQMTATVSKTKTDGLLKSAEVATIQNLCLVALVLAMKQSLKNVNQVSE